MTTTSNIGLGSLSTSTTGSATLGTTLFGVDVDKLIDGLVEARSVPNLLRQDRIDANTAKLSAYSSLQGLLTTLQSTANTLRNPSTISGDTDAFDAKQTLSRASGTIAASDLYGVSASSSATVGSYALTINRVAKADTISGTVAIPDTDSTVLLAANGNLTLNGETIALTNVMNLSDIRDAINDKKADTGVTASIVQAGASDYRLVLKGSETGKAITLADDQAGAITTALGIATSGATDTTLSAEVVLDGVTITSKTNSLNDLIAGVSIELYQADPGKPVNLTVDYDLSGISESVSAFLAAYNDVVAFVKEQRAVGSDGSISDKQVLFSDSLLQSTYRSLQGIIGGGALGISAGNIKLLDDVGITLSSDGTLSVEDASKFEDALLENFEQVRALFGFSDQASSGITLLDRPDTLPTALVGKAVTLRVTATDGSGKPTAAEFELDGVVTAATVSGGFIRGAEDTAYEGLVIGYTGGVVGGTPYTGTFTLSQGVADQVAAAMEKVLDADTGSLQEAKDQLTDANTRMEDQNTRLTSQLDLYRSRLSLQFQAAQEVISMLENQKSSITSYMDSLNSGN